MQLKRCRWPVTAPGEYQWVECLHFIRQIHRCVLHMEELSGGLKWKRENIVKYAVCELAFIFFPLCSRRKQSDGRKLGCTEHWRPSKVPREARSLTGAGERGTRTGSGHPVPPRALPWNARGTAITWLPLWDPVGVWAPRSSADRGGPHLVPSVPHSLFKEETGVQRGYDT